VGASEGGRLVAFAYGYLGAPGQWWHDKVRLAMTAAQRARWLGPGHFEFVELAVRPEYRRRGIGSALHDAVLQGVAARTAVLSTQVDNGPALALYRGRGWRVIVERLEFEDGAPPYLVMGLELAGQ
jgi:ribosomal protein S18 acetylase RimI-like enzyme